MISEHFPFCVICDELIIDPVTLPCGHELCLDCFQMNMQSANFTCSLCRKRVSTWARKNSCNPINKTRKAQLQELYESFGSIESVKLAVKLQKEEESKQIPPRVISSDGDLLKEYKDQVKAMDEQRLMEDELSLKEVQKYREEAMELDKQIADDEQLARFLSEKENADPPITKFDSNNAQQSPKMMTKKKQPRRNSSQNESSLPKITKWFAPNT